MHLATNLTFILLFLLKSCFNFTGSSNKASDNSSIVVPQVSGSNDSIIIAGAERTNIYFSKLHNKRVGVVANQTSLIASTHLVDSLLSAGIKVTKVYTPEHGFRGVADAGEHVSGETDQKTGLRIISLYGNRKKPLPADLQGIDIMVFDLQDVGTRFYTYISTLTLVMEACAENSIPLIILDRPNPNGFFVDGPTLETKYKSFVGMHNIPIVHGLTMAEYGYMVNEEGWLSKGIKCNVEFVKCSGYDHSKLYTPPVKPSPNLPDIESILLYPSLCLFEGTRVSVGRGTDYPFSVIGHPNFKGGNYSFTPKSRQGATNPPFKDQKCYGYILRDSANALVEKPGLRLHWLIEMYNADNDKPTFFNSFFSKLAGNELLQKQIESGMSELEIKKSWETDLTKFRNLRKMYLLYKDFTTNK